jgi:hypothetical protein
MMTRSGDVCELVEIVGVKRGHLADRIYLGELKGNKQAEDVKEGLGSVGGLKVGL